jgi:plastocyanin
MKRGVGVVVVALALVAVSCSSGPKGAQTYSIQADAATHAGRYFQFSAFYPAEIKARPGDTITIVNGGSFAPHSVSFGVKADHSNAPPPVGPGGENPAVFKACVLPREPTAKLLSCPAQYAKPAEYTGKGYWNGFMLPKGTPAQEGPSSVTVKLSSGIAPGTYHFVCLLHPPMQGNLEVVSSDSDRKKPADVAAEVTSAVDDAVKASADIKPPTVSAGQVAAGYSSTNVAVNEFYPKDLTVKSGTKVTWKDFSDFEPHTVTFGSPMSQAGPGPFLAPSGVPNNGSFTGGKSNSGIFGGDLPGPKEFSLVFATKGKYSYLCELHPGMVGTVTVN